MIAPRNQKFQEPIFGRVVTAMVTPTKKVGWFTVVDYQKARQLARYLIETGSDAVLLAGTTGEGPILSRRQEMRLFKEVADEIGRDKVICNVGTNDTVESARFARKVARVIRPLGLMLICPYYNKPSQMGLYWHFKMIADAVYEVDPDLPIMLYNVPGRTGVNLEAETCLNVAWSCSNVRAIKEASSNFEQIRDIINGAPDSFVVYSGNDEDTVQIVSLGGVGVVSVASHFVGQKIQEMVADELKNNREGQCQAFHIEGELRCLFHALFCRTNPEPTLYGLARIGMDMGLPQLPLVPLWLEGDGYCLQIDQALEGLGFALVDFDREIPDYIRAA
jgi:4-hydroxy-tetrahydrodipicolinate synthase